MDAAVCTKDEITVIGQLGSGEERVTIVDKAICSLQQAGVFVASLQKYETDGGDLHISCVVDAQTDEVLCPSVVLQREEIALDEVLYFARNNKSHIQSSRICAFIEYFDLVLTVSPFVLQDFHVTESAGDVVPIEFVTLDGDVVVFTPAQAMGEILSLCPQEAPQGAIQLRALLALASGDFDHRFVEAMADFY